jgi:hypothetical protein
MTRITGPAWHTAKRRVTMETSRQTNPTTIGVMRERLQTKILHNVCWFRVGLFDRSLAVERRIF